MVTSLNNSKKKKCRKNNKLAWLKPESHTDLLLLLDCDISRS